MGQNGEAGGSGICQCLAKHHVLMFIGKYALTEELLGGFVVGLDEGDDLAGGGEELAGGGEDEFLAGPGDVDHRQIDGLGKGNVKRVGALHDDDAIIPPQAVVEHAVACVYGEDLFGTVTQEAIGKTAGVAAEIDAGEAGDV